MVLRMKKILFDAVFIILGYGNDPSDKSLQRYLQYAVNLSRGFTNPLFILEGIRSDHHFPASEAAVMANIAVEKCGYTGHITLEETSVNTDENIFKAYGILNQIYHGKIPGFGLDPRGYSVNVVFDKIRHLKVPDFCKEAARKHLYRHPFNIIGWDFERTDREAQKQIVLSLLEMTALRWPWLRRQYASYKRRKITSTKPSRA